MKPFRAAIVGTGVIANNHISALHHERERVEVLGAVDANSKKVQSFCEEYGIANAYTDMQIMLDEQRPNLVHICTPPSTHFELCVKALRHGSHVICEKPLVGSLDEVDRLQALERETGLTCSTIFQWRFGSGAQHLKRLIETNALGRPLLGLCNTTWYRDHAYYEVPWRGKWDTELGGVSMGHGIHAMDMFLWLMGDWVEVHAIIGTLDRTIEVEDVSMAHVHFANGALGSIVNSVLSPREVSYLRFDFQRATVELEHLYSHTNNHWRFSAPPNSEWQSQLEQWKSIETDIPANHTTQLTHTLDALECGEAPLVTGQQARNIVEFLTSLYKSAFTRQPVTRGVIDPNDPFYYHVYGAEKPGRNLEVNTSGIG
jgi:predicted dehydrogenase